MKFDFFMKFHNYLNIFVLEGVESKPVVGRNEIRHVNDRDLEKIFHFKYIKKSFQNIR